MNPLHQIALNISQAFADKTALNIRLSNQRKDLEARQLALTPLEGWEGKNAELRATAEKRAYTADDICQQISAEIARLEDALSLAETALETAVNQRRAEEWRIRQQLIEALTGNVITTTEDTTRVEDTAFDDWADEVAAARLEEKFADEGVDEPFPPEENPLTWGFPISEPSSVAVEDDIPF